MRKLTTMCGIAAAVFASTALQVKAQDSARVVITTDPIHPSKDKSTLAYWRDYCDNFVDSFPGHPVVAKKIARLFNSKAELKTVHMSRDTMLNNFDYLQGRPTTKRVIGTLQKNYENMGSVSYFYNSENNDDNFGIKHGKNCMHWTNEIWRVTSKDGEIYESQQRTFKFAENKVTELPPTGSKKVLPAKPAAISDMKNNDTPRSKLVLYKG